MKLTDVVSDIESLDENLIVFIKDKCDADSDVIISEGAQDNGFVKTIDGIEYSYLIEVFLAKEFIEDWTKSLDQQPSDREVAKRLFEYAIRDA